MSERPNEILLVEDNINDADLSLYALRKNKIITHVFHAQDGAEALEYIFGADKSSNSTPLHLPSLILLDLKLPKIDGQEVLRNIKGHKLTRKIPVVILTSSGEEKDIEESYELGVNSYVVKPIDFDLFTQAVREIASYWLSLNQAVPSKY